MRGDPILRDERRTRAHVPAPGGASLPENALALPFFADRLPCRLAPQCLCRCCSAYIYLSETAGRYAPNRHFCGKALAGHESERVAVYNLCLREGRVKGVFVSEPASLCLDPLHLNEVERTGIDAALFPDWPAVTDLDAVADPLRPPLIRYQPLVDYQWSWLGTELQADLFHTNVFGDYAWFGLPQIYSREQEVLARLVWGNTAARAGKSWSPQRCGGWTRTHSTICMPRSCSTA